MGFPTPKEFQDLYQSIGLALAIAIITNLIGWMLGFFRLPEKERDPPLISFIEVIGAFVIFLFVQLLLMPFLAFIFFSIKQGKFIEASHFKLAETTQGWFQIISILITGLAILGYTLWLPRSHRRLIVGEGSYLGFSHNIKNIQIGSMAWLLSYPILFAVGQAVTVALLWIFKTALPDQVAVKSLKATFTDPILFYAMVFTIICIVPAIEELIFRGYLQTWLRQTFGLGWGIVLTAIIFSSFHYATSQGVANIDLVLSLFVLACYLGFVYERQRSLVASWGLHATFNLISIIMISIQEDVMK